VAVRQRQVEDRRLGQEAVGVVQDAVGVLHARLGADHRRRDVTDEQTLVVVEQHLTRRLLTLGDAFQENDRASDATVGAHHQRFRWLAIAAHVAILVDRQGLQRRRRPRELHASVQHSAVLHYHFFISASRGGEREDQRRAEQRGVLTKRFDYEDRGGCGIPPDSPPIRVAPDDTSTARPILARHHASTARAFHAACGAITHGSGFTKYSIASQRLRL